MSDEPGPGRSALGKKKAPYQPARMRTAFPAALLCLLAFANLHAYEAVVRGPHPSPDSGSPDVLPEIVRLGAVRLPKEIRTQENPGYAIVRVRVAANGDASEFKPLGSHPLYVETLAAEARKWKWRPGRRDSVAVEADVWLSLIVNPESSPAQPGESRARLAEATLVTAPAELVGASRDRQRVVWTRIAVAADGSHALETIDSDDDEPLRPILEEALARWKFVAATRDGGAIASSLTTPVVIVPPPTPPEISTPPKPIHREPAVYPETMNVSGLRGEVVLTFIVDEKGVVINPVVEHSSNPGFDAAAIKAILAWRFEPGTKDGVPVRTRMMQPMRFQLDDSPDGGGEAFTVQSGDVSRLPPELRFDVAPRPRGMVYSVYPHALLAARTRGSARVAFLLDEEGRVAETRVVEATHPEFGAALVAAVEMSDFEPARRDGEPTATLLSRKVDFAPRQEGPEVELLILEKRRPSAIVRADALDAPLEPVSRRPPIHPIGLRETAPEGRATIEFLVDKTGVVRLPRVVSATDPAFGYAAVQCVQYWRFQPPLSGGKPVVTRARVPIVFKPSAK